MIFHKVRDILHCHSMFDIELSEAVTLWDAEEKVGNIFTASVKYPHTLFAHCRMSVAEYGKFCFRYNNNNNDRLTAFDPGQLG